MVWNAAILSSTTVAALYSANRLNRDLIEAIAERWLTEGHENEAIVDLAFPDDLNLAERRAILPEALRSLGVERMPGPAASLWELNRFLIAKLADADENYAEILRELVDLDLDENKPNLGFAMELGVYLQSVGLNHLSVGHFDKGGSGVSLLHGFHLGFDPRLKSWNDDKTERQQRTDVMQEAKRVLADYYGEARRPEN